jgi:hypothetical protein
MNKLIRIVENGVLKETTDFYCKKVKLSHIMDAKQIEKLMENISKKVDK